jgi:hypothetical protein
LIADSGLSDLIAAIVRTGLEIYIFSPRRRGKLRDKYSRAERIERIYDWREATLRSYPKVNQGLLTLSPTIRPSSSSKL